MLHKNHITGVLVNRLRCMSNIYNTFVGVAMFVMATTQSVANAWRHQLYLSFLPWMSNAVLMLAPRKGMNTDYCQSPTTMSTHRGWRTKQSLFSRWYFHKDFREKSCILISISLMFDPNCPIGNVSDLLEIMAWCRTGDMHLSQTTTVSFTRLRWDSRHQVLCHLPFSHALGASIANCTNIMITKPRAYAL